MPYRYKNPAERLLDTLERVYFDEADLDLPEEPGLYFVTTAQNIILYIGRSENMKRRWRNGHHQALACLRHGAQFIYYMPTTDLSLEGHYIYEFNPAINGRSECSPE